MSDKSISAISPELKDNYSFEELLSIIAALRDPETGCPWDLAQTPKSLKKFFSNEMQEVFEAIDKDDSDNLCEELGDVLFEILLTAQMMAETGAFSMSDVISRVSRKMIRRHPHVFAGVTYASPEEQRAAWQAIKAEEKEEKARKISRPELEG